MTVTIRRAHESDTPLVVEFNQRMAQETEGKTLALAVLERGVRAILRDAARGIYFVAEQGDLIVGQLMITTEWSDWRNGWIWWIQSVYVRPEARRQGVFRLLYEAVCDQARQQGVIGVRLYVEQANHGAQATYRRVGMADAGYLVMEAWFNASPGIEGTDQERSTE